MKVEFSLSVRCSDDGCAKQLESVLAPDNRMIPRDQHFSSSRHGDVLAFSISSPRVASAISSLESLLSDVQLFSEVRQLSI